MSSKQRLPARMPGDVRFARGWDQPETSVACRGNRDDRRQVRRHAGLPQPAILKAPRENHAVLPQPNPMKIAARNRNEICRLGWRCRGITSPFERRAVIPQRHAVRVASDDGDDIAQSWRWDRLAKIVASPADHGAVAEQSQGVSRARRYLHNIAQTWWGRFHVAANIGSPLC